MAKRNRAISSAKYKKWIKEGRGQGVGVYYKPWLTIHDVSSTGRSHRINGFKINREHHFLSDHERDYFYIVEFADSVVDIREQYPLTLSDTLLIAEELGIEHPQDVTTKDNYVLTTDMLLTISSGDKEIYLARTIKEKDELLKPRQMEKFEIEKRYWDKKGIDWGVVTELEINKTLANNLHNIRMSYDLSKLSLFSNMAKERIPRLIDIFLGQAVNQFQSIQDLSDSFDIRYALRPGTAITLFHHLILTKKLMVNLSSELLDYERPIMIELYQNGL